MALHRHTAHRSETIAVHLVHCRPHDAACGPEEHSPVDTLAFPLRGVFLKHHSSRVRVVGDACHALFFKAGEPYRVSHFTAAFRTAFGATPSALRKHGKILTAP